MKNKLLVLLITVSVMISLSSCTKSNGSAPTSPEAENKAAAVTTQSVDDVMTQQMAQADDSADTPVSADKFGTQTENGPTFQDESSTKTVSPVSSTMSDGTPIDVDLTVLSSSMVYSEVYNMMMAPTDYVGKIVKMTGAFSVYHDPNTDYTYYACIIKDATACCQQGLEFILAGDPAYPADYPDAGSEITVAGEFQIYYEGEYMYLHLVDAELM